MMSRASRSWAASSPSASSARACPIDKRVRRDVGAHFLRQPQQPHVVGDRRPILPHRLGNLFLRQVELVGRDAGRRCASSIGLRSSRWMFSMSATARSRSSGIVAHDDRDLEQAGALRGAPAPFAGDDLVAPAPTLRTTIGWMMPCERIERDRSSMRSSSICVRGWNLLGRSRSVSTSSERSARRRRRGGVGDQRAQAAAERGTLISHGCAPPGMVSAAASRARNSRASAR